jgi:hypothetical protein
LLWLFQWLFVLVMPVEEEDQVEGKKKKKKQGMLDHVLPMPNF